MRNIVLFITMASLVLFSSCRGERGPQGPPGGVDYAQVFEKTVSYSYDSANNQLFTDFYSFPFTVYESDVVLGFHYEGQTNIGSGQTADVWTPLPQNVFYNDGTGDFFQYNFNHTFIDVQFTIEGNFQLSNIDPNHSQNQTFRIAVVPSEFAKRNPSMSEILEVMKSSGNTIEIIEEQ